MILYTDGGCNKEGTYGSFRIENDKGEIWELIRIPDFKGIGRDCGLYPVNTNNEAEYATMADALFYCKLQGHKDLVVYSDSQLMINQLNKEYKINKKNLRNFAERIWRLMEDFDTITLTHVPRDVIVEKLGH
jgi:ribonuclease HI